MGGPLDGVRVLDFTRYQQGPFATTLLADLGADVLKVEERGEGEVGRRMEGLPNGFSPYFESYNRGKRDITLDLRRPEAIEIIHRLLPEMDVLVENFRPGVMDRLGLGYDELHARYPRLVYAAASAFGPEGPLRERPGYDHIAQAVSGLMIEQAVLPGADPIPGLPGLADQVSAMLFAYGIVSALLARERTGEGQRVQVSLLGSMVALQGRQITRFLYSGKQGRERWRRSPTYSHYKAKDGWVAIAAVDPRMWAGLCRALDREDLLTDERFAGPWDRDRNAAELEELLEAVFATRPVSEWVERLVANDVPCGPVNGYGALADDPQLVANGYLTTIDHPNLGPLRTTGVPIHLSGTPPDPVRPAPELGQHTEETLLTVGYTWEQIEKLRTDGVI
jgi:CoA:oxalate CoA-transferase